MRHMCTPNSAAFMDGGFFVHNARMSPRPPEPVSKPSETSLSDALAVIAAMDQGGVLDSLDIECRLTVTPHRA
jgi:hypothetical protein